jgi:ADP-ribose pyrophosphatase
MPNPVKRLGTKVVYDGRKVRLEVHDIEDAAGRKAVREVVRHGGSVAVLALRRAAAGVEVLLERNYRYTVDGFLLEIPAGTLDRPGEPLVECARRELIEETGYRPTDGRGELMELLTLLPSPGILSERLTVFVTEEVAAGECDREPGEMIEVVWTPWAEALTMVRDGRIVDAKTIAALLFYDRFERIGSHDRGAYGG